NKRYIQSLNYSSTMPFVSGKVVGGISFKLPNIEEQLKIRNALISFDKKIELNRQTNQTLEQMAQTLFKSWFVDFDPVFDKLLAKIDFDLTKLPSDFPEVLQKRAQKRLLVLNSEVGAATKIKAKASLQAMVQSDSSTDISNASTNDSVVNIHQYFPSEFEHNEQLGWIPKGWESGQIDTHAKIEMGQSPKGDTYNDSGVGTPLVNGPVEFGPYFTKQSKWTTSPTKLSKKNDLIVCVRGSTTGRYVKSNGEYCLGWGVCSIRGKKSQAFTDQLYKYSIREMLGLTTGSTFPNWSRQTLSEFKSIVPSAEALQLFDELVAPKIEKVEIGVIESQSLTQLRDTL
ncbi:MAG: restriction endonuclease subunit S, partial [Colwellia sp.]